VVRNTINLDRRNFLHSAGGLAAVGLVHATRVSAFAIESHKDAGIGTMRFGLVTYMWGADWDVPTLLANCEKAGALGVELRTGHAHGVDPGISVEKRREVKKRFADSPVKLVGLGSNEDFHDLEANSLESSIDRAKEFIKLSHEMGGSGVKVKPNDLPKQVPQQKTIEQIGKALNELGAFGADLGQQVRLEVHGQCAPLPIIAAIMQVADHPNVAVCWNSNPQDLQGEGLEQNFRLVQKRLGTTLHARELGGEQYPYPQLFKLLQGIYYNGWVLIEASDAPADRVAALGRERRIFEKLIGAGAGKGAS
jgi:sugar phosphate isomerase/epimerase